jgi:hypothetical protein
MRFSKGLEILYAETPSESWKRIRFMENEWKSFSTHFLFSSSYSWRIEDGRDPPFGMFDNLRDLHLFTHTSANCSGLIAEESASMTCFVIVVLFVV